MRLLLLVGLLAACDDGNSDVVGPFTGATHRYVVDSITLPSSVQLARSFGVDLNGDDVLDNQLGQAVSTLAVSGDATTHGQDIIAGGAIASSVEIVADDLDNDPTVSVRYLGADGADAVVVGGKLEHGSFLPNRTVTSLVPGAAELHLPIFLEADPSSVSSIGLEIFLVPDGNGGFDATIHGGVPGDASLFEAVHKGIAQMIASDPGEHRGMLLLLDTNPHDGVVTYDEVANNSIIKELLVSDVSILERDAVSIGLGAHLRPCPSGSCAEPLPFDRCFDRVVDGDETDVDCGGSCRRCEAAATCRVATDCETTVCDQGRCGSPSCSNDAHDGLESDVDCGANCSGCALGKRCFYDADCASGQCGVPCMSEDPFDCIDLDFDADTCM